MYVGQNSYQVPLPFFPLVLLAPVTQRYTQRRRRHFKSGQATGNERLFVHVYRVVGVDEGGGRSTTDNVRQ